MPIEQQPTRARPVLTLSSKCIDQQNPVSIRLCVDGSHWSKCPAINTCATGSDVGVKARTRPGVGFYRDQINMDAQGSINPAMEMLELICRSQPES